MSQRRIEYAIDEDTGLVVSRVGDQYAWMVLDYEGMKPENHYQTKYYLEKISFFATSGTRLRHTRKIPVAIKNYHREFWGMKQIKEDTA